MTIAMSLRVLRGLLVAIGWSVFLSSLPNSVAEDAPQASIPVRIVVVDTAALAEQVLQQLRAGADFAVIAKEHSVDATSIDGGFMGFVERGTLRSELTDALGALAPGELSGVVQIPSGFAILKRLRPAEVAAEQNAEQLRRFALGAVGSIRYAPDVSGLNEAETSLLQFPKPDDWNQDLRNACKIRQDSFAGAQLRAKQFLDPSNHDSHSLYDVLQMRVALGQMHAYMGEMDQAVQQWELGYQIAPKNYPETVLYMDELLGVGYLHKSEIDNEVYRNPGERCLFPPRAALKYTRPAASEKAIRYFLHYLEQKPADLEVKWLLNLIYMTLGRYPEGVDAKYLLPPASFVSAEDIGRFTDMAPEAGLNFVGMAGGVIVDDFDNDGLLDVVASSFDMCAPLHFFHNNGDGTFTDRAGKAGLSDQLGGLNLLQVDYNNDGCLDLLVLRGGWEVAQRKSLLRNNCNGTFTDVTREAGLAVPATSTQAAVWTDIDNDGLLDLFVGNENGTAQLFLNNGDGTFKDISHSAHVDRSAFTKGVAAADYDGDGFVDLYVSNQAGDNFLYHNNHDGTFTEIAKQAGVLGTGRGFATWFFDYDNDGWPDLFVTSYYMSIEETAKTYLGLPHGATTLKLYKNLGNGAFRDVTIETGLDKVFMPMGANFGDIDNDGYLDIYMGTGNPSYGSLIPNVLLHNKAGKSFVDITASSGTGDLHKGHGVAFADIDNDGEVDILTSIGGAVPGDSHAFRLFHNPGGHGNDWIGLRLTGVKANRSGVGARIKLTVRDAGGPVRSIYRTIGSGGSFGASPLEQHIGLGKSAQVLKLEIWWPGGGPDPQTFTNTGKNQWLDIRQFDHESRRLARRQYRIGGPAKTAAAPSNVRASRQ